MSAKRASTRTASVAAIAAALARGLVAASAVGDDGGGHDGTTPTESTPTDTTPADTTPTDTTPAVAPPPLVEATQPAGLAPASSGIPAAPPVEAELLPALTAAPQEGVKGEFGTRDEGQAGTSTPTVVAQTEVAQADVGAEAESTGRLAQTGFSVLILAILGAVALAGSSLLFWRSNTA